MNSISKEYIFPSLITLLPVFAVFFPAKLTSLLLMIIFIFSLLGKRKKINFIENKRLLTPYLVFIIFCVIATLVSKDISISLKSLEKYSSLLIIPVAIIISELNQKKITYILRLYIIFLLIVSLISVGKLIWFVNTFQDWIEVMRDVNKNNTYVQFKYPHLMWDVHPSYWSYLILIGNVILLNNKYFNQPFSKFISIILLILFNFNLLYLSARVPILVNLVIHLIAISAFFINRLKLLVLLYGLIFIIITVSYLKLPFFKYKIDAIASDDRFFLWEVAYNQIKKNLFITGEGFGLAKEFTTNYLKKITDPRSWYKGDEIHNQYLSFLLETGILGFLSLLYIYIATGIHYIKKNKLKISLPSFYIIILITLASVIEPFFSVIKGIVIFATFSSLFRLYAKKNNNKYEQV